MDYAPDVWVIVEISGSKVEKSPYHRVLAGWYGGYAGSDSWKMNSGITQIVDKGNWYEIHGSSGSIYNCNKQVERLSNYTASIFQSYAEKNCDDISLKIVDIADVLGRYTNDLVEPPQPSPWTDVIDMSGDTEFNEAVTELSKIDQVEQPLSNEEATAKIQKLAAEGKITYAETDEIEDYEIIAREFLKTVFDIDYDECFISDESSLSDFTTCCCPEDFNGSLQECNAAGKEEMLKKILTTYGLEVDPYDYLIAVFERIRQQSYRPLH